MTRDKLREHMTRRRMLTLGTVGFGMLIAGDQAEEADLRRLVIPRARPVIPPVNTAKTSSPTPRPAPPRPQPIPPRIEPVHRLHDLNPNTPANAVALTIDDGPHPEWTPRMLDLLDRHGVKATFSLIGVQVKEFPKLTERIVASGHDLCNHTMYHPLGIAEMSSRRVDAEITQAHHRIADVTGVVPRFFRAPGGNWSKAVLHSAARHGMQPIDWDIDPRDWERPGVGRIRRVMLRANGGNILLCHDGGGDRAETIKALEKVIPRLKQRGLTFVRL